MKKEIIQSSWALLLPFFLFGCSEDESSRAPLDVQVQAMYESYRDEFPAIGEVSVDEVSGWMSDEELVLVDVREDDERAVSMLKGAITKDEFEADAEFYQGKKIIVYCTIGYRSGMYVKDLDARGVDAFNLQGSILAWVNAGQPLYDPSGKLTSRVHVYGEKWNLVPEEYEAIW